MDEPGFLRRAARHKSFVVGTLPEGDALWGTARSRTIRLRLDLGPTDTLTVLLDDAVIHRQRGVVGPLLATDGGAAALCPGPSISRRRPWAGGPASTLPSDMRGASTGSGWWVTSSDPSQPISTNQNQKKKCMYQYPHMSLSLLRPASDAADEP